MTYSEKLSKTVLAIIIFGIIAVICWYFRNVLAYVIMAALVAVLAVPITALLCKIHIKRHYFPSWLAALLSILAILLVILGIITMVVPLFRDISQDISSASVNNMAMSISVPLSELNGWMIRTMPKLGPDFRIESVMLEKFQSMFDVSQFTAVVGSVTSFVSNLAVGLFSVIFIAFFFIREPGLFKKIVLFPVPAGFKEKAGESLDEIRVLITRYFVGISIEVLGVALLNFLGLALIARMGIKYSLGIAFLTGLLNVIPYLGPLIGYIVGAGLSLIIKYACATPLGLDVGMVAFVMIILAILIFTQLVDNVIYQPLIYSTSVKSHPLEIFLVFIAAGSIGGFVGMIVAIPAYTVLRVIVKRFLLDTGVLNSLVSTDNGQQP